jgi:hypothetical protein
MKLIDKFFGKRRNNVAGNDGFDACRALMVEAIQKNDTAGAIEAHNEIKAFLFTRMDELADCDMSNCSNSVIMTLMAINSLDNFPTNSLITKSPREIYAPEIKIIRAIGLQLSANSFKARINVRGVVAILDLFVGMMDCFSIMDRATGLTDSLRPFSNDLSVFAEHLLDSVRPG